MSEFFMSALQMILPLLGTAGAGLIVWVLRRKFNLQITKEQEVVLSHIFQKSIAFANEWAHKKKKASRSKRKKAPSGEEKLLQAVSFAKKELKRAKIKIPDEQVNDMLHAALGLTR